MPDSLGCDETGDREISSRRFRQFPRGGDCGALSTVYTQWNKGIQNKCCCGNVENELTCNPPFQPSVTKVSQFDEVGDRGQSWAARAERWRLAHAKRVYEVGSVQSSVEVAEGKRLNRKTKMCCNAASKPVDKPAGDSQFRTTRGVRKEMRLRQERAKGKKRCPVDKQRGEIG